MAKGLSGSLRLTDSVLESCSVWLRAKSLSQFRLWASYCASVILHNVAMSVNSAKTMNRYAIPAHIQICYGLMPEYIVAHSVNETTE